MPTRRRRADSDSWPPDAPPNNAPHNPPHAPPHNPPHNALLQPALLGGQSLQLPGAPQLPWAAPQDAYYKKTDQPPPAHPLHAPPARTSQPPLNGVASPGHPRNGPSYAGRSVTASQTPFHCQGANSSPWANFSEGLSSYLSINTNIINNGHGHQHIQHHNTNTQAVQLLDYPDLSLAARQGDTSDMACRDRTAEFASILRSQQNGPNRRHPVAPTRTPRGDLSSYTAFMQRARLVGRNISSTYAKLEKLTQLAKKRSLFDDSSDVEVQELTTIIGHDLQALAKQLADLKPGDGQPAGQMQKHSKNLVGHLQGRVASVSKAFKGVLEVRTENLKRQAERREHFTGAPAATTLDGNFSALNGGNSQQPPSVLLADEAKATSHRRGHSADFVLDLDDAHGHLGSSASSGALLQLEGESNALLRARAEDMRSIESTIVELGGMFTQLATMVKEQDELVHRIDANVDDAEMNVEAAHSELLKYFRGVSSNRWLMVKVFGIVMVFMLLFVVFMA